MDYPERVAQHLRITILRFLQEEANYALNEDILLDLTVEYAFDRDSSRLRKELRWLEDQGLVELKDVNGLYIATLTKRGSDVANGKKHDGVKKPEPRL
ncbi:ArsR family transcriptional regulator [Maridesulfovibrio sp.]|uniref:VpaChn25_0724 family phage protein n=1 Tax=Maridesulfovibrio sp. TaxID=2795000 RepID=UPI002A18D1FB|nr:ArsR family transcriptional regulator [Maridesulfovibrio sp.]